MSDSSGYSPLSHAPIQAPDILLPSIPVTSPVIPVESPATIADIYSGTPALHRHDTPTPPESQAIRAETLMQQTQAEQQQQLQQQLQTQQQLEQQQLLQQQQQQQIEQRQRQLRQATSARSTEVFSPYSQSQRHGNLQTQPPGYEQQNSYQQPSADRHVASGPEIFKKTFIGFVIVLMVAQAIYMVAMMVDSPAFYGAYRLEDAISGTPENEGVPGLDNRSYTNEALGISFTLSEGWVVLESSANPEELMIICVEDNYDASVLISKSALTDYDFYARMSDTIQSEEIIMTSGIAWRRIPNRYELAVNYSIAENYITELPNEDGVLMCTVFIESDTQALEDVIDMLNSLEFID